MQTVIGHAITVHRALGPGLFESVYARCFAHELGTHGVRFRRQVPLALTYQDLKVSCAYRADLIIEDELLVELKAIDRLLPVHNSQVLTYLRLSGVKQGLLINFNVPRLGRRPKELSDLTLHVLHPLHNLHYHEDHEADARGC